MEENKLAISDGHFREGKGRAVVKIGLFLPIITNIVEVSFEGIC
jgi:hypothetical protein